MYTLIVLVSNIIFLYTMMCIIRMILTWFPGAEYSTFGRILSNICDPYLNIFRKLTWLRIGAFDFSAAIGVCVLWAASSLIATIFISKITLGGILAAIVGLIWQIVRSVIGFLLFLLIARLIVLLVSKKSGYGTIWDSLDRAITPFIYKIVSPISRGRPMSFIKALVISILVILILAVAGEYIMRYLNTMLKALPV